MREVTIAVVGATGAVGLEFIRVIEQRHFPASQVRLLASKRSAGKCMPVLGEELVVEETTPDSFGGIDIAFISASSEVSAALAPYALEAGALVIDDSSFFRMRPDVPLVVPEVNGEDVEWHKGIISIPNCSTTPLVMVAKPLHDVNPIVRIIADTYQSVSGAGGAAMTELEEQTRGMLDGGGPEPNALPARIAGNVIPRIDSFLPDGYTREERKMLDETRKIMHDQNIAVSATCVRVPVYLSHSAALHVEFERPMSSKEARELLRGMPGVIVMDSPEDNQYPMPLDAAGTDEVFVGRIRNDVSHPSSLAMWVVADNLRKGAALNAVQIAEEVLRRNCLAPVGSGRPTESPGHGSYGDNGDRAIFDEDLLYYRSVLESLLEQYEGKYVAILNKTVVDSDDNFSRMAKRVYDKYGYKAILMTRVEPEPRVVHIPSRHLTRKR